MLKNLIKLNIFIFLTINLNFTPIFATQNTHNTHKIFMVTGETSAEQIGAWYLTLRQAPVYAKASSGRQGERDGENPIKCEAIGGQNLQKAGAQIYDNYKNLILGAVGPIQFIKNLPDRWYGLKILSNYILENNFSEVILIDCPLTNIPLMYKLKKSKPEIKITYIAPPEMWIWGKWGLDYFFKNYSDKTIVVYPFEANWYKKQGLETEFLGWPGYEKIKPYLDANTKKENKIALCPGSRKSEIKIMLPIFLEVAQIISKKHPEISFILPIAEYISKEQIEQEIKKYNLKNKIEVIKDDEKLFEKLSSCCIAISKPGTITLFLALLKIPTIITFKIPLITYLMAKLIFQKSYVGLPNLFLDKEVFKELIQGECNVKMLTKEIDKLYQEFTSNSERYQKTLTDLEEIKIKLNPQNINSP
ncbi:MAG: hypothetical protein ABIA74_00300 [bacterium]